MSIIKSTPAPESSENSNPREKSCHHERHLSGVALKVYNLIWRFSKKSKSGSVSITNRRIAQLVGVRCEGKRADYITRVKISLVRDGWLEFLGVSKGSKTGAWRGGRYQPVSHKDWVEVKVKELGLSPCHPQPLQIKVSSVHPGGRSFRTEKQKMNLEDVEVRTVKPTEACTAEQEKRSHRAGGEARTDLHTGSTHGLRSRKHAQSVDSYSGDLRSRREGQLTQEAAPPATPKRAPALPEKQGGVNPSQTLPERQEEKSLPTPTLSRREQRLREFNRFVDEMGISGELSSTPTVRYLKESFVMEPLLSPRRRLAALLEQARIQRFNVHPAIVAAMRQLEKSEVLSTAPAHYNSGPGK